MGLFNLDIPTTDKVSIEKKKSEKTCAIAAKLSEVHCRKIGIIDRDVCSKIEPGQAFFVFTTNQINTVTFIEWIFKHYGFIESLTISTYSISSRTLSLFKHYFNNGFIGQAEFIICEHMKRLNDPRVQELESMCRNLNIHLHFKDNHSKILLAAAAKERICIMGSGNFAENSHNEQYLLINDGRIFDFYRKALLEDQAV